MPALHRHSDRNRAQERGEHPAVTPVAVTGLDHANRRTNHEPRDDGGDNCDIDHDPIQTAPPDEE